MWRVADQVVRAILVLGCGGIFLFGCWLAYVCWELTLDYPTRLAGTGYAGGRYPPLGTWGWYRVVSLELAQRYLEIFFPFLAGTAYALAATLKLTGVTDVLRVEPPRVLHLLVVVLCVASSIAVTWSGANASAMLWIWGLAGVPALAGWFLPCLRRHAFQIIGVVSGLAVLMKAGAPWQFVSSAILIVFTAAFIWFEPPTTRAPR